MVYIYQEIKLSGNIDVSVVYSVEVSDNVVLCIRKNWFL